MFERPNTHCLCLRNDVDVVLPEFEPKGAEHLGQLSLGVAAVVILGQVGYEHLLYVQQLLGFL